jgi:hypothetical protein
VNAATAAGFVACQLRNSGRPDIVSACFGIRTCRPERWLWRRESCVFPRRSKPANGSAQIGGESQRRARAGRLLLRRRPGDERPAAFGALGGSKEKPGPAASQPLTRLSVRDSRSHSDANADATSLLLLAHMVALRISCKKPASVGSRYSGLRWSTRSSSVGCARREGVCGFFVVFQKEPSGIGNSGPGSGGPAHG